ncbi:hypothetical protein FDUTEX481_06680 [Tolypothrix sp. PCC 7601]|nr:hypothetical protein FDUTEX481_06680 [Tolypothrix sp. PCC 7601]
MDNAENTYSNIKDERTPELLTPLGFGSSDIYRQDSKMTVVVIKHNKIIPSLENQWPAIGSSITTVCEAPKLMNKIDIIAKANIASKKYLRN